MAAPENGPDLRKILHRRAASLADRLRQDAADLSAHPDGAATATQAAEAVIRLSDAASPARRPDPQE